MKSLHAILRSACLLLVFAAGCTKTDSARTFETSEGPSARLVIFVGVDISGSFINGGYYDDSLQFLANYIYLHLKGWGGIEQPTKIFVGSIGGAKPNEPKTFFPIQSFENKSVSEIEATLKQIFPKNVQNPFTDYNAFFDQVAQTVKNRKMVLKPISIVLLSDGKPDVPNAAADPMVDNYRKINLAPLEQLSRNITIRLLYTDAVTGRNWQNRIPRNRVKIWTQDAKVMVQWKSPTLMKVGAPLAQQSSFFSWILDNVDFNVRGVRVD